MTGEPIMRFGAGDLWFWTSDTNGIPDHPPVHLGKVSGEALAPEPQLTFGQDYQLGPPVPITLEDLHAVIRNLPEPPPARRLEVGAGVADYLRRTTPAPASPIPPDLWAIPVVETPGIPPGGWRIVDHDGEVRTAGLIGSALLEER